MFERQSDEPIYNTRAVVQRTHVPADTFRAWERRYGVPSPCRTSGNQRLYSERDISIISWLRDKTNEGLTISQAVALLKSQNALRERSRQTEEMERNRSYRSLANGSYANGAKNGASNGHHHQQNGGAPFRELRDDLVSALLALDGNRADRIVEEALALTNLENVCLYVLQGSLFEIGSRWEHGTANVAIEHHASSYVQRKFAALFNQSNPNEGRGPIVAACPEGEQHDIGLLLTSLFLSRRGYRIIYLGANMPLPDLIDVVQRVQPPLVILSATREDTARRIAESVGPLKRAVHDVNEFDLPEIGYGGHIFALHPELRLGIDGAFLGTDAREAIANVDRIFAGLLV